MKVNLNSDESLDKIFSALSDKTRRGIIKWVSKKEVSATELANHYEMSLPGIMKHLKILENARLVSLSKEGRVRKCNFEPAGLKRAQKFISEYKDFWNDNFDRIEKFLAKKNN